MGKLISNFKKLDIPFLFLFLLSCEHFIDGGIIDAESKLLLTSSFITILFLKFEHDSTIRFQCFVVLILLLFNLFVNDCGIGGILGAWQFFLLLCLIRHSKVNDETFRVSFYLSIILLFLFSYKIYKDPTILVSALGGDVNSNMAGMLAYYILVFIMLFIPNRGFLYFILFVVTVFVCLVLIAISGSRATQAGAIVFTILYLFLFKSINKRKSKIVGLTASATLIGGLLFVFISISSVSQYVTSILGFFSDVTDNVKGDDLSLRGIMWQEALDYYSASPIIGTGSKIRLKSYGDEALALHNSSMNILIVYGAVFYLMVIIKLLRYFKELCNKPLTADKRVLVGIGGYIGILIISYGESNLMDFFYFYSLIPLIYAYSYYNRKRFKQKIEDNIN